MEKIIFVCHGNICRSPIAEFLFKDEINKRRLNDRFIVISRAVSDEGSGYDIDFRAKDIMDKNHIPYTSRKAKKISKEEYDDADIIFCMDNSNISYLKRMFPDEDFDKVKLLIHPQEISDPWYTHNFQLAYMQIHQGIVDYLNGLTKVE